MVSEQNHQDARDCIGCEGDCMEQSFEKDVIPAYDYADLDGKTLDIKFAKEVRPI